MPNDDLGGGVTAENVITLLNENKCFDFDYTPSTDDTLYVYHKATGVHAGFFTLIFQNGAWATGNNPPFISIKKTIAKGILKTENV